MGANVAGHDQRAVGVEHLMLTRGMRFVDPGDAVALHQEVGAPHRPRRQLSESAIGEEEPMRS